MFEAVSEKDSVTLKLFNLYSDGNNVSHYMRSSRHKVPSEPDDLARLTLPSRQGE